jgi:hypothetical protein
MPAPDKLRLLYVELHYAYRNSKRHPDGVQWSIAPFMCLMLAI